MFEKKYSYEEILPRMLEQVPEPLDKREGSVIFNALAPVAAELAQMYIELDGVVNLAFIDTSVDEYLDKLVGQMGIVRREATKAIKKAEFYNNENELMDIEIGKRFGIGELIYVVKNRISQGVYQVECETNGIAGNAPIGILIPVDNIEGLGVAKIAETLIPGTDIETDEELRERYYEKVNQPTFAGNIADYKAKTKEIEGVGAVKVIPTWNGGGTVKLIILDTDFNVASEILIEKVQELMCPNPGQGLGIAPIGHDVTVVTATEKEINISTTLTLKQSITTEIIQEEIESVINDYLLSLKRDWQDLEEITVRVAQLESRILNVDGVIDITNTLVNGSTANIILSSEYIPKLGEVVLN